MPPRSRALSLRMPLSAATSIWPWRSDCSVLTGGTTTSSTCLISSGVRPPRLRYSLTTASRWAPRVLTPILFPIRSRGPLIGEPSATK